MRTSAPSAPEDTAASPSAPWPALLRLAPRTVLLAAVGLIALAWLLVVLIDLLDVGGVSDLIWQPAWYHLFNDRPVEWAQWVLMIAAVLAGGYLAGRAAHEGRPGLASFALVFGLGVALMFVEDAGNPRHVLTTYVENHFGTHPLGLHHRVVSDLPYFALLAAVPVYAVLRHGRHAWSAPSVRPYLVGGYGLYGLLALLQGVKTLRFGEGEGVGLYAIVGSWIDSTLLGGRFPSLPTSYQSHAHFHLVDGAIEESLELVAAACLLGVVLALARDLRAGRLPSEQPPGG